MFCRNCKAELVNQAVVCPKCGMRPFDGNNYCNSCGSETLAKAVICTTCGSNLRSTQNEERSPVIAGLLNWIWTGSGNIYLGQTTKGILFCLITLGMIIFDIITCSFGLVFHIPYMVIMIIDAALLAGRINKGEIIDEWKFF